MPRHQSTATEVALDEDELPHRVVAVERHTHPILQVALQCLLVAGRRQCGPSQVPAEVEIWVVLPVRRAEGRGRRHRLLREHRVAVDQPALDQRTEPFKVNRLVEPHHPVDKP